MKTRLTNVPIDLDEEMERTQDEQVQLAVAEQETRKATFQALRDKGLPIPSDLLADFQPQAMSDPVPSAEQMMIPTLGQYPTDTPALAPTGDDISNIPPAGGVGGPGMDAEPIGDGEQPQRPEESDEMRANMPKPAALHRQAQRMRDIAKEHYSAPGAIKTKAALDEDGNETGATQMVADGIPRGGFASPKHVGMRRYLDIDFSQPIDEA